MAVRYLLILQNIYVMENKIIAPSLLAADFANLQNAIQLCEQSKAKWLHLDVMDGVFVPNISFGMPVIKAIKKQTDMFLDTHLMIVDPDRYTKTFADLGVDLLTVHYEACDHLHRSIQLIKENGMQAGVAINPHTHVSLLEPILKDVDLICIMSVNPGFGGQKFIENTYGKIVQLRAMIKAQNTDVKIEIDGGVTDQNIKDLEEYGADVFVAGSHVFKAENPIQTIEKLYKFVNR
jgi:ribulose-phosphate 3-epimerase